MLKWLRLPDKPEGQCEWDAATCSAAAGGGHLDVLKWLRLPDKPEGQCPWDKVTCYNTACISRVPAIIAWINNQADAMETDD